MRKRVLVIAAVLFTLAMLIAEPLTTLAALICFGDEAQRRAHRSHL